MNTAFIMGNDNKAAELRNIIIGNGTAQWQGRIFEDFQLLEKQLKQEKPQLLFVDWEQFSDIAEMESLADSISIVGYAQTFTLHQSRTALQLRIYDILTWPFSTEAVYEVMAMCGTPMSAPVTKDVDALEKLQRIITTDSIYRMSVFPNPQPEVLRERWALMCTGYSIVSYCHCILELRVDEVLDRKKVRTKYYFEIRKNIKEVLAERQSGLSFNGADEGSHCILFCVPEGTVLTKELVRGTLKEIAERIALRTNYDINVGISQIHNCIEEMPTGYSEARISLGYQSGARQGKPVFFDEINIPVQSPDNQCRQLYQLSQLLMQERYSEAKQQVHSIISGLKIRNADDPVPTDFALDIASIIRACYICRDFHCEESETIVEGLNRGMGQREVESVLEHWIDDFAFRVEAKSKTTDMSLVEKAQNIICTDYHRNLSLGSVAEQLYINPSYLSRKFHEETGQRFVDYLISVRIEHAKNLLMVPELKVYRVGELIGYPNKRYFSKIFRERTGISPSEYRSRIITNC